MKRKTLAALAVVVISVGLLALVVLAGFTGLRTGELLGLRRSDVDLLRR